MTNKNGDAFPDLNKIVREQFEASGLGAWLKSADDEIVSKPKPAADKATLVESYVAQPKTYGQVSETLSAKTKASHTELYKELIESLNRTSAELDTSDRAGANANASKFRDLKLVEAHAANGVYLHELYFSNCFDPHSEIAMDMKSYLRLESTWGTFADAQRDISACALSARNGWMVLGYSMHLRRYVTSIIDENSMHVLLGLYPVLVLDMHDHAYYRDYLTDKRSYIIAQMREINWSVVEARVEIAEKIAAILK